MFNFLKKKLEEKVRIEKITYKDGKRGLMLRHDAITTGKDNIELLETASKNSGIPVFKGPVKNLYESDFTGYKDKCPLCQTELLRMFSNFAYATQEKARIMTAPTGLFCPNCPTVIIDDDMAREVIDQSRFEYWGVFLVDDGYSKDSIIETINGVKPTFIVDENQDNIEGIMQSVHQPGGTFFDPKGIVFSDGGNTSARRPEVVNALRNQKAKNKSRNKNAKKSKKANRKK